MEFTEHFNQMLKERSIQNKWVERAIRNPDNIEDCEDGTRHFIKQIEEYGNRWLRVIVNVKTNPNVGITVFFDRRLGGTKNENQS